MHKVYLKDTVLSVSMEKIKNEITDEDMVCITYRKDGLSQIIFEVNQDGEILTHNILKNQ